MPVESAADRLSFLADFGEVGTYTAAGGGSTSPLGIFNSPFMAALMNEVSTSDTRPTFVCRLADLPAGAQGGDAGDTLSLPANEIHGALSFTVSDLQPDGTGMVCLTL